MRRDLLGPCLRLPGKARRALGHRAYEKDRIDPVDPNATLTLDREHLTRFPEGYRHLAYLQSKIGYPIKLDLPGHDGPELAALYAQGEAWLKGKQL